VRGSPKNVLPFEVRIQTRLRSSPSRQIGEPTTIFGGVPCRRAVKIPIMLSSTM
jgi:hypothetical protein